MITIGTRRECFFDDFLIDRDKTSAGRLLHKPQIRELTMTFDSPWEGDGCDFFHFFYDEGIYRMYYLGWSYAKLRSGEGAIKVCYAESKDGVTYSRPALGICEFEGSKENNIILDEKTLRFDNFYVFKDENPDCPENRKYKAVALDLSQNALIAFYSADAIHFEKGEVITRKGAFDTLNVAFWDQAAGIYRCYIRGFHVPGDLEYEDPEDESPLSLEGPERNKRVRDIRYLESKDFVTWTRPVHLDFGEKPDIPLYTNVISRYPRAPHILVGFPTRYVERQEWTGSFEVLCGAQARKERMQSGKRMGLAITDCIFMTSRDGVRFTRYDEAFIRPGAEHETNWVYGSGYPTVGFVETPSHVRPDCDHELSMFCFENHLSGKPTQLRRYTLRLDGFCSMHAGEAEEVLVTRPFVFEGKRLFANLSTSAWGYLYFELSCGERTVRSCEMFGDSTQKLICFEEDIAAFAGRETVLTVHMRDADLYSIQFCE